MYVSCVYRSVIYILIYLNTYNIQLYKSMRICVPELRLECVFSCSTAPARKVSQAQISTSLRSTCTSARRCGIQSTLVLQIVGHLACLELHALHYSFPY